MLRYLLVVASIVIGMFALITPKPIDNESEFSAERAFDHIEQIAKVPHTIEDKDALEDVREYLVSQLNILGVENEITTYTQEDDEYDITEVNNILVTIPGESDSYILLVAHYDSSPAKRIGEETGSLGAADDGYGLSTILETLNVLLKNNVELKNGIKVLFSDAEEIGLYGAKREVERNPSFFSDVAIVINIEARGVK